MNIVLSTILTDASAREVSDVEAHVSQELSAGIPWFDEA